MHILSGKQYTHFKFEGEISVKYLLRASHKQVMRNSLLKMNNHITFCFDEFYFIRVAIASQLSTEYCKDPTHLVSGFLINFPAVFDICNNFNWCASIAIFRKAVTPKIFRITL